MLDHLYPIAHDNAIEAATVAISWNGERDPKLLGDFLGQLSEFQKLGLTDAQPIKGVQVLFGPNGVVQTDDVMGQTFRKISSGIVLREVSLQENQIVITRRDYTRWEAFLGDVTAVLNLVLPLLAAHSKVISVLALQYVDKFQWRAKGQPFPTAEALKDSAFFPRQFMSASDQWHSNQGFYVETGIDIAPRRLENLNITLGVENGVHTLSFVLAHSYQALQNALGIEECKILLNAAHLQNKEYLQQLLADDLCERIGLRGT